MDTSVAIKWVVEEVNSSAALEYLPRSLIAPDLFQAEVGNVLTRKVRRREIAEDQATIAFDRILSRVSLLPSAPLGVSAFRLSLSLAHSIYDCYFLAAAEAHGPFLLTADEKFVAKVRATDRAALVYLLGEEVPNV